MAPRPGKYGYNVDNEGNCVMGDRDNPDLKVNTDGSVEIRTSLAFDDSKVIYFGTSNDVSIGWDGTNLVLKPVADDTGAFHIGDGTTDFDVKVFLSASTKYVLFDVGNALLTLEDVDLKLGDNDILQFGDAAGGDVSIKWNASNLVILPAADDTGAILVGDGTTDMDVKVFLGASTAYALFDVGNARLTLEGIGLRMMDDDLLTLGDDGDIVLVNRSAILNAATILAGVLLGAPVTPAVAANSLILSNVTASGDILVATNLGGNSQAWLWVDTSASLMTLYSAGVSAIEVGVGVVVNEGSADRDFRVESNGMAYAVAVDGGKDALVLGSNTDTSSSDQLITVSRAARTATAATNYYDLIIAPAGAVTVPAGVTAIVSTARFDEPNITATGTVTLAATIYLASQPSEGSQNAGLVAAKDVSIAVGDAAQARLLWESADADANALLLQLPAGGATDVPVLAIGQSIENVGLGLFDGVVDPNVVMFGAGAVTTGPRLRSYKARGTIAAPTAVTTGDDLFSIDAYGAVAAGEYVQAARILFEMTGTIATTRGPGVITFQTATDAAPSVLTTAMTISAAQLVTCASLTSTGAFTASSTAALNGNVTVADDILLGIGTGNTARLSYDTTDENANELLLQLPAGGGTDVPVVVIGQAIESVDLGLYDGVVDPRIAMFGVGAVTTGSVLEFRKARGTVAAPTVCTTGDDLGTLDFYGAVAAGEYVRSASIRADIAGTIATTRGPGTLTFLTATDAAPSVLTAALTLGADQSATFANRLLLNGVAASGVTDGSVIRMGTSGSPLVDDQAGAGFVVGYFDSGATSGWPAGLFISTNVTGAGGSFTALQGDAIVTAEKATVTGIESFFQFATPGRVTGAARACQATIDFGNYDFGSGGVYSAACFNIKGEGAAVDIGTVQRVSCLELKTEGTFSAVSGENFDTKPAGYAIYFNGFTAASGVTNILSSTRLAELPAGTIGIRVGVGADGAAGDVYYIPLVPAAEWN